MYPLLLKPVFKDYIWGGNRLKSEFGFETAEKNIAEAWVLSCHKNGESEIENGEYKGKKLSEVLKKWGIITADSFNGQMPYFPLLIKLIDAKEKLSVQVHPNDEYAFLNEKEFGKTEMWYIIDAEPNAEIIYGFKKDITKEEIKSHILNGTLTDVCNYVPVKKGDAVIIPAGTLHAIGKGILIAEVQQNSNTTYRVFDYGRTDVNGNLRELHIGKALDVVNTEKSEELSVEAYEYSEHNGMLERELAKCKYFTVKLLNLDGTVNITPEHNFASVLVLNGNLQIHYGDNVLNVKKGHNIFIPGGITVEFNGNAELLYSYV